MEEELVEKKEPSKYGKASIILFVLAVLSFWICVLGTAFADTLEWKYPSASDTLLSIMVFVFFFWVLTAIAIFPVSIIGIIKSLKKGQQWNSEYTAIFVTHIILCVALILLVILKR